MTINVCTQEDTELDTCIVCGLWCDPQVGICDMCELAFGEDASFDWIEP